MMNILPQIVSHSVLICVDKRERGIALQALLQKYGYRTFVTQSLYEAMHTASQELPHLIITESLMADGNAGDLYDKLQASPILRKIPLLTCVLRKTREEIAPLVGRQFAGIFMGRPNPQALLEKVREILTTMGKTSPFFLSAEACGFHHLVIARDVNAIAKSQGFLIVASGSEIDYRAQFQCRPQTEGRRAVDLSHGVNIRGKHDCLNLFPIDRIRGAGRAWIDELREIAIPQHQRRVALSVAEGSHAPQWGTILSGHGYQAMFRTSLEASLQEVSKSTNQFECILHIGEITKLQAAIWRQLTLKYKDQLPALIVATPQQNIVLPQAIVTHFPCGLGEILHALAAGSRRFEWYGPYVDERMHGMVSLTYRTNVQFLGLDETGGYLQSSTPLSPGMCVKGEHPFFDDFFSGQNLTIYRTAQLADERPAWQARFDITTAGQSKVKRWEKLLERIAPHLLAS